MESLSDGAKSSAQKTGQTVSASEAAKQLLESARDDRLELANLLTEPTDSLLNIRGNAEAHMLLTQAEWALVAYYRAKGAQAFMSTEQGQLSYDSLAEGISRRLRNRQQKEEAFPRLPLFDDASRGQTTRCKGAGRCR